MVDRCMEVSLETTKKVVNNSSRYDMVNKVHENKEHSN